MQNAKTVPITFEIQNEPDLVFFIDDHQREMAKAAELYATVINAVCKKMGGPKGIAALGGGIYNNSPVYAEEVMKLAGKSFEIMAIHPYAAARRIGPYANNCTGPEQKQASGGYSRLR